MNGEIEMGERKPHGYWTEERMSEYIWERKNRGQSVSVKDVRKKAEGLVKKVYRSYGSWSNFLSVIGIPEDSEDRNKPGGYWTKERISEYLWERKNKGLSVKISEIRKEEEGMVAAVYRHYGSWSNFLSENGMVDKNKGLVKPRGYWTAERMRTYIWERKNQGLPITSSVIAKLESGIVNAASRNYGGWKNFLRAIGIEDRYEKYSNILDDVYELIIDRGCYTKMAVGNENTLLDRAIVRTGGWKKVLKALKEERDFDLGEYVRDLKHKQGSQHI